MSPPINWRVIKLKEVSSTQDAARNYPPYTVVLAEKQIKGRGRLGRVWYSPPGGVWASFVLPRLPHCEAFSIVAALSVVDLLKSYGIKASIKWPNDVLVGKKKIAGILGEVSNNLILGIGINVNIDDDDFPEDLRDVATSIYIETNKERDIEDVFRRLLFLISRDFLKFKQSGFASFKRKANKQLNIRGKRAKIRFGRKIITATIIGFAQSGALRIQTKRGEKEVSSAEIISWEDQSPALPAVAQS